MSTTFPKRILAVLGLLALVACVYLAVSSWMVSARLHVDKGDAPVAAAQLQLERLDLYYTEESRWQKKDDGESPFDMQPDLDSVLRLSDPILATVVWGETDDEPELDNGEGVHGSRKMAARALIDEEERDLVQKVKTILESAGDGGRDGAAEVDLDGRTYQFVWRRMTEETVAMTGVKFGGFVISADLDRSLMDQARRQLVRPLGVSAFLLLLTAVAVLALSLLKARRDALQKTTFVANVSHELRTPLTSLMSYAEMLATGRCRTEEKQRKACTVILDEGRRLNRMIQELLEFSRLERGTRQYRSEDFDLAAAVRETAERLAERFAEHGLEIQTPDALAVCSDRDTVREVLENLLTNAAKYAAQGGPVEVAAQAADGRARIAVSDRGPGMTRTQMRKAFKAFWRADNSTTRTTGGYGIGLAVARAYARGLGGDLTVTARPGGGCTFLFEFPIGK